MKLFNRN